MDSSKNESSKAYTNSSQGIDLRELIASAKEGTIQYTADYGPEHFVLLNNLHRPKLIIMKKIKRFIAEEMKKDFFKKYPYAIHFGAITFLLFNIVLYVDDQIGNSNSVFVQILRSVLLLVVGLAACFSIALISYSWDPRSQNHLTDEDTYGARALRISIIAFPAIMGALMLVSTILTYLLVCIDLVWGTNTQWVAFRFLDHPFYTLILPSFIGSIITYHFARKIPTQNNLS